MTNYVYFLLETDAAKRRLAELFESETLGSADHRLTAIVPRDGSRAARTSAEKNNNVFREYRCTRTPVRSRTRTAIPTIESGQTKRDLTVSSFVLALVLVGVVVAMALSRQAANLPERTMKQHPAGEGRIGLWRLFAPPRWGSASGSETQ